MRCKLSDKCDFGDLCKYATRHDSLTVLGCSSFKEKEPLTNEEWRKTCSAEDFAYWLADVCAWAMEEFRCGNTEKANIDYWKMWLKEKHDGNVL
jgi:hypothetical protein